MKNLPILKIAIMIAGGILAAVAIASQARQIVSAMTSADVLMANIWFFLAGVVGLVIANYDFDQEGIGKPIGSAVAAGIAFFLVIFAISGNSVAAALATLLGLFAVLNLILKDGTWLRAAGLATVFSATVWLTTSNELVDAFRATISGWTTWLSSMFLDSFVVPHTYVDSTLETINGVFSPDARLRAWDGVLAVIAFAMLPVVYFRWSLTQALLITVSVAVTWIFMHATASWWIVWQASGSASVVLESGTLSTVLYGLFVMFVSAIIALTIGGMTEPIYLERSDWDYPVTTYFWNFFVRFPASIFLPSTTTNIQT